MWRRSLRRSQHLARQPHSPFQPKDKCTDKCSQRHQSNLYCITIYILNLKKLHTSWSLICICFKMVKTLLFWTTAITIWLEKDQNLSSFLEIVNRMLIYYLVTQECQVATFTLKACKSTSMGLILTFISTLISITLKTTKQKSEILIFLVLPKKLWVL